MRLGPLFFSALLLSAAHGAVKSKAVEYKIDTVTFAGMIVSDASAKGRRPGVLLFSDWMGVNDYARAKAEQVAKMGYVVFVADIYGKGKNPKDDKEAAATAAIYKSDRALMRTRAAAGLAQLKLVAGVDTNRLAAMGFCFGGTVALELARTGAKLAGTASVHGNLDTPNREMAKNIKGTILVLHGSDDPFVPAEQVRNFQDEMRGAGADWYMVQYGGAVHAFTKPEAGNDPSKGQAYNPKAEARALVALKDHYQEIFAVKAARK